MISDRKICELLIKSDLISIDQAKYIMINKDSTLQALNQKLKKSNSAGDATPPNIIDAIAFMGLDRNNKKNSIIDEDIIYETLAKSWGYDYKKIDPLKLDLNLVTTTIPKTFALKHLILPLEIKNGYLTVATCNPFNTEVLDDLNRVSQMNVNFVVSSKSDIKKMISESFGFKKSIIAAENQFKSNGSDLGNLEQYVKLQSIDDLPSNDHHIINAVNHIFSYAFDQRASDIHIEPKREVSAVRMRIDGVLHTIYSIPKKVHNALVSRIKAMSRLDMAEKRRPQDGRIKTDKDGTEVEIRVSTVPVAFGEKVVMRVLSPEIMFQELESLGFTKGDFKKYQNFINLPHGIIIVCGPTGSGKSTTLYSTLRQMASPEINITTVEDPIEMIHEDFNQIAVQPLIGITFGTILRNILRQDPDIIMLGEMRDLETAENAAQAAMTGHLVFSTLHTNDAPSVITRLLDLGIPSYIIQATLVGIIAQRLIRKICPHCKETYKTTGIKLKEKNIDIKNDGEVTLSRGIGCLKCRGTGYLGRIAIFEILPFSEEIKKLTTSETDISAVKQKAVEEGMVSLRENGILKLLDGETTVDEILRVTWGQK